MQTQLGIRHGTIWNEIIGYDNTTTATLDMFICLSEKFEISWRQKMTLVKNHLID